MNGLEQSVIVLGHAGIETWNRAAERMWGLREEEVVGRELFSLPLIDFARRARPAFDRMIETAREQRLDGVSYRMPGDVKERRARVFIAPVKDHAGAILGGVATGWADDGGSDAHGRLDGIAHAEVASEPS